MSVTAYLQSMAQAVQSKDGLRLAILLSLRHSPARRMKAAEFARVDMRRCIELVRAPLDLTAFSHLKAMEARHHPHAQQGASDVAVAFAHQRSAVRGFREYLGSPACEEANWVLPALEQLTLDLRLLASQADEEAARAGGKSDALELAVTDIRECFVAVCSDRAALSVTKKWGMMFLINHLFAIAFRLNNFAIVESFRRAMLRETELMQLFHLSHRITHSYHLGRLALFNSHYQEAEKELSFAFRRCHRDCRTNKRLLLIHLIPLQLLRGCLPAQELLEKYDLRPYMEVVAALRIGHVHRYKEALVAHQSFFVQWGVLLMLERALLLVYRRLLKRVQLITGLVQMPLRRFLTALALLKEHDTDVDEAECILSNLILRNLVRGYISHEKRVLVLSKKDPFPPVAQAPLY